MARSPDEATFTAAEVEALVTAKVNLATQAMMDLLSERGGGAADWSRQLAMAIAEMSDQGNNRKRVAPEEMAKRQDARVRLLDTLHDMYQRGVDLEYQLKRKVVLDEQLIEPLWQHPTSKKQMHTTISWPGEPNDAMEPMNDNAKQVFDLWVESVGGIKPRNQRQRLTPRGVVIVEGSAPTTREVPQVGSGEATSVRITRREQPGEVVETRILGTIAAPARQSNGRAAA